MSASDYLKSKVMNLIYAGVAFASPARFLALYTSTGAEVATSGTGYVRQALPALTLSGTNPTTSALSLSVIFPTATADWGTVTSWAIVDASSGGNILNAAPFAAPTTVLTGQQYSVPAAGIKITLV